MPESKSKTPPEPPEVEEVDESSEESFPASDPPSWTMGKRAEPKPEQDREPEADQPQRRDTERSGNARRDSPAQPGGSPKR